MSEEPFHSEWRAVAGVYRLLARMWRRELDAPLIAAILEPQMRGAMLEMEFQIAEVDETDALDRLAADFCQLFVGPKNHLPPFQSVWSAGQLQGEPAVAMQRWVELTSFESDGPECPADHLGVQLGVMSRLVDAYAAACESAAAADQDDLREMASRFFALHLCWPQPFLAAAPQRAESAFYRSLGEVTARFLAEEKQVWE